MAKEKVVQKKERIKNPLKNTHTRKNTLLQATPYTNMLKYYSKGVTFDFLKSVNKKLLKRILAEIWNCLYSSNWSNIAFIENTSNKMSILLKYLLYTYFFTLCCPIACFFGPNFAVCTERRIKYFFGAPFYTGTQGICPHPPA